MLPDEHASSLHTMARDLVVGFHRALRRPNHQPTGIELNQAATLIVSYGVKAARAIVTFALIEAQKAHVRMHVLGDIKHYIPQVLRTYQSTTHQNPRFCTEKEFADEE